MSTTTRSLAEYVGMLHAAVLLPGGTVKPDVAHFITFTHSEAQRAYAIACECNFIRPGRAMPKMSDHELLRCITDLVMGEAWERAGSPHTLTLDEWYYSVGDIVGWLSVHLFPWTHEDAHAARERMKDFEARIGYFPDAHNPDTDFYSLLHYNEVESVAA